VSSNNGCLISVKLSNKLFGNAAIYLGANILNAGIPFLLLPILTRVLTPADYGTVAMFGIALSVLGAFTGLSVHGAIGIRYFQLDKKVLAEYVGSCVGILAVSTATLFLLVMAFGDWLTMITGVPLDWLLVAVALSSFQFLGNIRLSLWQVSGQAKKYGFFQVSQSLFNAVFSLILILIVGLAWEGRVLGQAAAIGIFGIIALRYLFTDELIRTSKNWRVHCRDALNFGIPLIPHVMGGLILATAGQFLVTNTLGVSETGLYVVGVQFGSILGIIADAFVKSYGPWLYEKLEDDSITSRHFIVGITYYVFILFLIIAVIASVGVFIIFPYIVGDEFLPARFLIAYFIFGNAFIGMYYAIAGFFFFTSKTKYISMVTIISGSISIYLMWLLGQNLGIKGVALGYLFSQVIMFLLAWIMSSFIYPLPWLHFRSAFAAVSSVQFHK
jgi:O-antigen/teichoic acid export membrane protein